MFQVVTFLVLALLAGGCTGGIRRDFASFEGRVATLEGRVGEHDNKLVSLSSSQEETARLLRETAGKLETVAGRTEEAHKRIPAVEADVRGKLAAIERRVTGLRSTVSTFNARMGVVEDAGGLDDRVRAFRVSGFQPGKAEIPSSWSPEGIKKAEADSWAVKAIIGFADSQCPSNGNCEDANQRLADARAKAIAATLEANSSVLVKGRGSTDRFGGVEANRSVVVYLEREGGNYYTYTPLRGSMGPTGPAGLQGVKGDSGAVGPPGAVQIVTVPMLPGGTVAVNSAPASASIQTPPTGNP